MNTKKHSFRAFTWPILLLITVAILLSGCDNSTDQTSYSSPVPPDTTEPLTNENHAASGESSTLNIIDEDAMINYALDVAVIFHEPIDTASDLNSNPANLLDFLMGELYKIYKTNNIEVKAGPGSEQYFVPKKDVEKAAALLLSTTLPENIYNDENFPYHSDSESFLFSPFSPELLNTTSQGVIKNSDGTYRVTVLISQVEEESGIENAYILKPIEDSQWGLLYQLVRIERIK